MLKIKDSTQFTCQPFSVSSQRSAKNCPPTACLHNKLILYWRDYLFNCLPDKWFIYLLFDHLLSRTLMKYPPTTLLAWNPTCFPSSVSCQSLKGTLVGVEVINVYIGDINFLKSSLSFASVEVQITQSLFVYVFLLSSGSPNLF